MTRLYVVDVCSVHDEGNDDDDTGDYTFLIFLPYTMMMTMLISHVQDVNNGGLATHEFIRRHCSVHQDDVLLIACRQLMLMMMITQMSCNVYSEHDFFIE